MNTLLKKSNKLSWLIYAFFSVIISVSSTRAQAINYSGNWQLDEDKSDFGQLGFSSAPSLIKITQDAASISIERFAKWDDGKEHSYKENLSFDGRSSDYIVNNSHKSASVSWSPDHKALAESFEFKFSDRNGDTQTNKGVNKWNLSTDGKTLTLSVEISDVENKKYTATYVYSKGE